MAAKILRFMASTKKTMRQVIEELADREPRFRKKDGSINAKALAEAIGVSQPSISRALTNPHIRPRVLAEKLSAYFGITPSQARGEDRLRAPKSASPGFSRTTHQIAEILETLPEQQRRQWLGVISSTSKPAPNRKAK